MPIKKDLHKILGFLASSLYFYMELWGWGLGDRMVTSFSTSASLSHTDLEQDKKVLVLGQPNSISVLFIWDGKISSLQLLISRKSFIPPPTHTLLYTSSACLIAKALLLIYCRASTLVPDGSAYCIPCQSWMLKCEGSCRGHEEGGIANGKKRIIILP